MSPLLAVSRTDVARYVETLILVYIVLILIHIVFSWVRRMPYNRALIALRTFVDEVTGPYLAIFRRILPAARMGPVALDLSPIIGVFVLLIVQAVLVSLIL